MTVRVFEELQAVVGWGVEANDGGGGTEQGEHMQTCLPGGYLGEPQAGEPFTTSTGLNCWVVFPMPSCPNELIPQDHRRPSAESA